VPHLAKEKEVNCELKLVFRPGFKFATNRIIGILTILVIDVDEKVTYDAGTTVKRSNRQDVEIWYHVT
jgi:hypothetical protein